MHGENRKCVFILMPLWSISNCKGEIIIQGMGVSKEDRTTQAKM